MWATWKSQPHPTVLPCFWAVVWELPVIILALASKGRQPAAVLTVVLSITMRSRRAAGRAQHSGLRWLQHCIIILLHVSGLWVCWANYSSGPLQSLRVFPLVLMGSGSDPYKEVTSEWPILKAPLITRYIFMTKCQNSQLFMTNNGHLSQHYTGRNAHEVHKASSRIPSSPVKHSLGCTAAIAGRVHPHTTHVGVRLHGERTSGCMQPQTQE